MALFGFSKKPDPPDRYAGKPFIKLVDSFVLDCIGELDASQSALLVQMLPKLQQTFHSTGTWQAIVMAQLDFEPSIVPSIRSMWERNQVIAKQNGVTLSPMQFVEMFVANNVTGT
jgi:hypothetical protein